MSKQQEIKEISIDELKNKKIALISLGCDKNRVDLEEMMYALASFGFTFCNSQKADIVIVNTCAFILPARKEAVDNILEMVALKTEWKLENIIVTGCLPQRYQDELKKYLPEVDRFVQIKDNPNLVNIIAKLYGIDLKFEAPQNKQLLVNSKHYAYLKIADGCNNGCAYCTIPRIRGRYKSVPFNEVIARAKSLVTQGAKELMIVAQDITRYGIDLYKEYKLVELLNELSKIKDLKWIRLHYCYPELVNDDLLQAISKNEKICKYIDIPLQHIDNDILKEMNRRNTEAQTWELIQKIKTEYPEIAIRSTFIVGLPGETAKSFDKLCDFLKKAEMENVGFFPYSREEGTKAFYMKKQVPNYVKQARLNKIQKIQDKIATKNNLKQIGNVVQILIDEFDSETGFYNARTEKMSPNVDFFVKVPCSFDVKVGEFYKAKLVSYKDYSFIAEIV